MCKSSINELAKSHRVLAGYTGARVHVTGDGGRSRWQIYIAFVFHIPPHQTLQKSICFLILIFLPAKWLKAISAQVSSQVVGLLKDKYTH